jgi:hypothetical protein
MKTYGGEVVKLHTFLTSVADANKFHTPAALLQGKEPHLPTGEEAECPTAEEISSAARNLIPVIQPVGSQFNEWFIPPHISRVWNAP